MIEQDKKLPHFELTGNILNCCFEVMKELGPWKRLKSQYRFEHPKKNLIVISLYRFHR